MYTPYLYLMLKSEAFLPTRLFTSQTALFCRTFLLPKLTGAEHGEQTAAHRDN